MRLGYYMDFHILIPNLFIASLYLELWLTATLVDLFHCD